MKTRHALTLVALILTASCGAEDGGRAVGETAEDARAPSLGAADIAVDVVTCNAASSETTEEEVEAPPLLSAVNHSLATYSGLPVAKKIDDTFDSDQLPLGHAGWYMDLRQATARHLNSRAASEPTFVALNESLLLSLNRWEELTEAPTEILVTYSTLQLVGGEAGVDDRWGQDWAAGSVAFATFADGTLLASGRNDTESCVSLRVLAATAADYAMRSGQSPPELVQFVAEATEGGTVTGYLD